MMKNEKKFRNVLILVSGVILTIFGFIFIPPLLKKYETKIYKTKLKKEEIDFNNMGPEIVKKNQNI